MTTKKLFSWEEIEPFAKDVFNQYVFEICWARAAWDLLLKNEDKIGDIKLDSKRIESILWLFALYLLLFRFKWANGLEYSDTVYELDEKIWEWNMEKELSKYYPNGKTHKKIKGKNFKERFFEDCYKRAEEYKEIIKHYFSNDLGQINAFFDGDYYIEHYTNYDKERGNNDEEYDAEYDKYRCNIKMEWLHTSFLDNF